MANGTHLGRYSALPARLSALSESLSPWLGITIWMPQAPNASRRRCGCAGVPLLDHSTGTANLTFCWDPTKRQVSARADNLPGWA